MMILFVLGACRASAFLAVKATSSTSILSGRRAEPANDLEDFWRDMNTFDDDEIVVAFQSPRRRQTQKALERGEQTDAMSTVQFAPRIAQSSPGGDDYYDPKEERRRPPPQPRRETRSRSHLFEDDSPRIADAKNARYYRILGVPSDAPLSTVRSAFVSLTKEHHPDVGGDPNTFEAVSRAWAAISQRTKTRPQEGPSSFSRERCRTLLVEREPSR